MKTNVLSQPQTLRAVLMADTFASSKHLRGLHATHANVTTFALHQEIQGGGKQRHTQQETN